MSYKPYSADPPTPGSNQHGKRVQSSDKITNILCHTLTADLLPALTTLNNHKKDFTLEQQYDLNQLNNIVEHMDLVAKQATMLKAFSQVPEELPQDAEFTELVKVDSVLHALSYASTSMNSNDFFQHCVKTLASLYNCKYALISILKPDKKSVKTAALWMHGELAENIEYDLNGTPCADVICLKKVMIPSGVTKKYPDNPLLIDMAAEGYFGAPLMTRDKGILGIVAVLDSEPMQINHWSASALSVFAARITGEVLRHQALDQLAALNIDLEKQVQQRTHDLEISNQQLKTFNYSVSHDLRAPVRTINSFMSIVFEDYAHEFSNEAYTELKRIQNAGHRLDKIIESMLDLSRIDQQKMHIKKIDLSQMAEQIINDIRQDHPHYNITVEIESDLTAQADGNLLQIALLNLFDNAVKYSQNNSQIEIKLSAKTENRETVFCIEDNGAGFNMDYASKLFQPFRRLHSDKEFPGTGIGLATVKRVFDCHNGKVWAESTRGNGARFYFTLPALPD